MKQVRLVAEQFFASQEGPNSKVLNSSLGVMNQFSSLFIYALSSTANGHFQSQHEYEQQQ
jgi:hypothetical protein